MDETLLQYIQGLGFPDANHYGDDGNTTGISFGQYGGSDPIEQAQNDALMYAQNNGYPDATLEAPPPAIAEKLVFNN